MGAHGMAHDMRLFLIAVVVTTLGCSKEATPAAEEPKKGSGTEITPAAAMEPAADELASANVSDSKFTLEIKPNGSYKAGEAASVEVVLDAKAPFHCNDKYPYKLKLDATDGVKYPDTVVKKDAVKLEHMKATMTVPFTPESKGKKTIAGQFHFSLCSADKCLIEKRKLALDIQVD